jgi:hypothetical protein
MAQERNDLRDWTEGMKRLAHLRALLRLALSDVHQYYPQPASLTLHRTCTHPLHSFRPLTPQPNAFPPVPDMLRNIQIGRRRLKADFRGDLLRAAADAIHHGHFVLSFGIGWRSMSKNGSKHRVSQWLAGIPGAQSKKWRERGPGSRERAVYPVQEGRNTAPTKVYWGIRRFAPVRCRRIK